jgi:preprotein translocase subunit SecG
MFTFLLIIQTLVAIVMITVILMQRSEGGGLASGGSPSGLMTARGAADFLTRTTAVTATLFIMLSIILDEATADPRRLPGRAAVEPVHPQSARSPESRPRAARPRRGQPVRRPARAIGRVVAPAKAGASGPPGSALIHAIPASAGMTGFAK